MKNLLVLILVDFKEKQRVYEQLQPNHTVIKEFADFFYLEEELDHYERAHDHFQLETYFELLTREEKIFALSCNHSRPFWSQHLKRLNCNFDSILIFNLSYLQENSLANGTSFQSKLCLLQIKRFLHFLNNRFRLQSEELESLDCDYFFTFKSLSQWRIRHYQELAFQYNFKYFYLTESSSNRRLHFFYEQCLGLMLKEVLGLFHDHHPARHSSR